MTNIPGTSTHARQRWFVMGSLAVTLAIGLGTYLIVQAHAQHDYRDCAGPTKADVNGPPMTLADFATALQARAATVAFTKNPAGSGEWHLTGQAYNGMLNGDPIAVYDYRTAFAAYMETRCFIDSNAIRLDHGVEYVDTFQPTYWYRRGSLIVLYVGRSSAIPALLEAIMGPPFVGSP